MEVKQYERGCQETFKIKQETAALNIVSCRGNLLSVLLFQLDHQRCLIGTAVSLASGFDKTVTNRVNSPKRPFQSKSTVMSDWRSRRRCLQTALAERQQR